MSVWVRLGWWRTSDDGVVRLTHSLLPLPALWRGRRYPYHAEWRSALSLIACKAQGALHDQLRNIFPRDDRIGRQRGSAAQQQPFFHFFVPFLGSDPSPSRPNCEGTK